MAGSSRFSGHGCERPNKSVLPETKLAKQHETDETSAEPHIPDGRPDIYVGCALPAQEAVPDQERQD